MSGPEPAGWRRVVAYFAGMTAAAGALMVFFGLAMGVHVLPVSVGAWRFPTGVPLAVVGMSAHVFLTRAAFRHENREA